MCKECGCGLSEHEELHRRGVPHTHEHEHEHAHRTLNVLQSILEKNDRLAERNRGYFSAKKLLVLNLVSSPGSGKTELLRRTLSDLRERLPAGVIVGDLATDNDAKRLAVTGAPVIQIQTGTLCHLDAQMVGRAAEDLQLDGLKLLFIENVGNLVCPASFDLGEALRVVVLSVTEGEDKPLKYPVIFKSAHAVVVSKIDLAAAAGCDRAALLANIRAIAPQAEVFELSAKSGEGMQGWYDYLVAKRNAGS